MSKAIAGLLKALQQTTDNVQSAVEIVVGASTNVLLHNSVRLALQTYIVDHAKAAFTTTWSGAISAGWMAVAFKDRTNDGLQALLRNMAEAEAWAVAYSEPKLRRELREARDEAAGKLARAKSAKSKAKWEAKLEEATIKLEASLKAGQVKSRWSTYRLDITPHLRKALNEGKRAQWEDLVPKMDWGHWEVILDLVVESVKQVLPKDVQEDLDAQGTLTPKAQREYLWENHRDRLPTKGLWYRLRDGNTPMNQTRQSTGKTGTTTTTPAPTPTPPQERVTVDSTIGAMTTAAILHMDQLDRDSVEKLLKAHEGLVALLSAGEERMRRANPGQAGSHEGTPAPEPKATAKPKRRATRRK